MQQESPANRSMLRMAYYCGLTPLIGGISIFLLWCVTGNQNLELLGVMNIIVGLVLFWVGLICLGAYLWHSANDRHAGRALASSLLALIILVLNFPVCGMILYSVDYVQRGNRARELLERPVIHIHNATGAPITKLEVPGTRVPSTTISEDSTISLEVLEPITEDLILKAVQGENAIQVNFFLPRRGRGAWASVVVVLLPNGQSKTIALPMPQSRFAD